MAKRRTISVDLRERILACYDEGHSTREDVAKRFRVSVAMVKKLLHQRRRIGEIAPLHHRAGRKPRITDNHKRELRRMLAEKVDMTLREMREALGIACSLQAIHVVLSKMGLTLKKRRFGPANKTVPMSPRRGKSGGAGKAVSIPRGLSSSMRAVRKPI